MSGLFHLPTQLPVADPSGRLTVPHQQLFTNITNLLNEGFPSPQNDARGNLTAQSVTIPIAKLTVGGANGSLTFTNGILTAAVDPT